MRPEMDAAQAIEAGFNFGSKAETLERLRGRLGAEFFCEQIYFSLANWRAEPDSIVERCLATLGAGQLAVRSSTMAEDRIHSSMAGAFESVLGVAADAGSLRSSIETVIRSYGNYMSEADQVLVQPMIGDVAIAGVVVTRDLVSGAPYYVVNYDDMTGRTDSVTAGAQSKTVLVHRSRPDRLKSKRLQDLIGIIRQIEDETGDDRLDIEFCITGAGGIYILQVRPLAAKKNWSGVADAQIDQVIESVRADLASRMDRSPGLLGASTVFGQMPDWNPAEMIGSRPRTLAFSLYERQITVSAWSEARYRMGYRDLRNVPLMAGFAGQPFIDVRPSLNSFLPSTLDETIGEKLVDAQIGRLAENRDLHDKIEFEVAFPNYDFRFEERLGELREAGLDNGEIDEFRTVLLNHTASLLGGWWQSLRSIRDRLAKLDEVVARGKGTTPVETARGLLDACVPLGTVPFAAAARHGFVGVSLVKSMVSQGALSEAESEDFLATIETVAHDLIRDMAAFLAGELEQSDFLGRYGHLRPGTYDITSWRYDERPDLYLRGNAVQIDHERKFHLSDSSRKKAEKLAARIEGQGFDSLLEYAREAVELREWAKFKFTRAISDALHAIALAGEERDLDREALSYLTVDEILDDAVESAELKERIEASKERYRLNCVVRLPHLILSPVDVDVIRVPLGRPTFITQEVITAPSVQLDKNEVAPIAGHIVMIESADPGFDWIFSHDIAGLVTKFGGANSHMAIRCAEFMIPAAIGCGERIYDRLRGADLVVLNCASHKVEAS